MHRPSADQLWQIPSPLQQNFPTRRGCFSGYFPMRHRKHHTWRRKPGYPVFPEDPFSRLRTHVLLYYNTNICSGQQVPALVTCRSSPGVWRSTHSLFDLRRSPSMFNACYSTPIAHHPAFTKKHGYFRVFLYAALKKADSALSQIRFFQTSLPFSFFTVHPQAGFPTGGTSGGVSRGCPSSPARARRNPVVSSANKSALLIG